MKLLHRANASDRHVPWAPSNERTLLGDSSNLNSNRVEAQSEKEVSKNDEEDAENHPRSEPQPARNTHDCNQPQTECIHDAMYDVNDITFSELVPAQGLVQKSAHVKRVSENSETLGGDGTAHIAVNVEAKESTLEAATPLSRFSQSDSHSKELDAAEMTLPQETSASVASPSGPTSDLAAQSLSHFTRANIIALKGARAVRDRNLYEQHWLLKFLGRTDLPQHSSKCGSYGEFLAYSGQSITYILSHVDALLQSFLHFDDSNATSKVIWSYDFASTVDSFRKLRRIDMHPYKIFPSLWISAGSLYPLSSTGNKLRSLTTSDLGSFSLDPASASQGGSLNDVEACHVAKIILAALVASVPKCSPMGWLAVRRLHASGQVAPFIDADNSPAEQQMIEKLMRTLHAFEDERALSLVIRLARSIDIRYHLARARELADDFEKYRRQHPPTFSRVIDYVYADKL